jgi:hypothetical protein
VKDKAKLKDNQVRVDYVTGVSSVDELARGSNNRQIKEAQEEISKIKRDINLAQKEQHFANLSKSQMTDAHEKELKNLKEKLADIQRKFCETEDINEKEEYQFMIDKIEKDIAEEMESYKYLSQRWKMSYEIAEESIQKSNKTLSIAQTNLNILTGKLNEKITSKYVDIQNKSVGKVQEVEKENETVSKNSNKHVGDATPPTDTAEIDNAKGNNLIVTLPPLLYT